MTSITKTNPYIGPRSFRSGEKLYGRTREINDLIGLLIAERIVVLHSPSGAGKTSLIQATLIPRLEAKGFQVPPTIRVNQDTRSYLEDANLESAGTNRYVLSTLLSLEEAFRPDERLPLVELAHMTLMEYLTTQFGTDETEEIVLIFDQFEEVLTTDPTNRAEKVEFFTQLGELLQLHYDHEGATNIESLWALFSMREDYVASLEPYGRFVPTRFKNHFRLDLLSVKAARQAIQEPVSQIGVAFVDEAVEQLIDELRLVRVQQPDGSLEEAYGPYIEPVELQVVCHRLWNSLPDDAKCINIEDIQAVGSVDTALAGYYADQVAAAAHATGVRERTIREWFDQQLITTQGIRGQVLQEVYQSAGLANSTIQRLIEAHLVRGERRRGAIWFELAHDRLINPIRTDNTAWFEQNLHAFQRQAALWEKQGRPDGMLFSDESLDEAERWADQNIKELTITELDFLEASFRSQRIAQQREEARQRELEQAQRLAEEQQRRAAEATAAERRLRERSVFLGIAMVIALATSIIAVISGFYSRSAQQQADRLANEASQLALERTINTALQQGDPSEALALLLATTEAGRHVARNETLLSNAASISARKTFMGHTQIVNSVAFSPDGQTVLSASQDRTIRLWDIVSGEELQHLRGHTGDVTSVVFSPDGQTVLSASNDRTIRLWDIESGKELQRFIGHTSHITSIAFSPDGQTVLSGAEDTTLRVWDVESGKEMQRLTEHNLAVYSVALSPYASLALSGLEDGTIRLWDITNGKLVQEFNGHGDVVESVAFTPDGKTVLSASSDRTIRTWNTVTGEELHRFIGHTDVVSAIAVNPDGETLVSGSFDGSMRLWDIQTGWELRHFAGHQAEISSLAISPDGTMIASGSWDTTMRLWDITNNTEQQRFTEHSDEVFSVTFAPDGETALSASRDNNIHFWRYADGEMLDTLDTNTELDDVTISPDGTRILAASPNGLIKVWDIEHQDEIQHFHGHTDSIKSVAFSPDGRTVVSGSLDRTVRVWDVERGTEIHRLEGHDGSVWSVAFSPDGSTIASASADETIRLWDTNTGEELQRFLGHEHRVHSVVFSPDGTRLLTGSDDQTIRLWDVATGEQVRRFVGHERAVRDVAFSPDGKKIASASVDRSVRLWDVVTGEELRHFAGHADRVYSVTFSPDGSMLLSGSADHTARLWRIETQQELITWIKANRYIPELSCEQHQLFAIDPCPVPEADGTQTVTE